MGIGGKEANQHASYHECVVSPPLWALVLPLVLQELLCVYVSGNDPDTFVMINRQKAIEALRDALSFVAPALVDLMLVRVRTIPAARAKSSHMYASRALPNICTSLPTCFRCCVCGWV
jgi:hypothetical protein